MRTFLPLIPLLLSTLAIAQSNKDICDRAYKDSPVERGVCRHLGERFPNYRDCLIEGRDKRGEGFVERHVKCVHREPRETRESRGGRNF